MRLSSWQLGLLGIIMIDQRCWTGWLLNDEAISGEQHASAQKNS